MPLWIEKYSGWRSGKEDGRRAERLRIGQRR
jgi:hypothetical protein